jgi:hypothetical protein
MRKKMMGGGMSNRKMYGKGSNGKLKMVTNKEGKKVPFYAADGVGKMAMGGRVKKMGGGSMMMKKREAMKKGSIPPQLKKFVMAKKKKAKMKKKKA